MTRSTTRSAAVRIVTPIVLLLVAAALEMPSARAGAASPEEAAPIQFVRTVGPLSVVAKPNASAPLGLVPEPPGDPESEFLDEPGAESEGEHPGGAIQRPGLPTSNLPLVTDGFVGQSWQGLNHLDNRYSDAGNQFSSVPPDQGLCVGGNRSLEVVNSVLQVYDTSGNPLLPGTPAYPEAGDVGLSLNQFYGEPSAFIRPDGPFGPNIFDPSCLYDPVTQRWFVVSADLELDADTGDYTGQSGEFIAVSSSADPLGTWNVWFLDTTNNGTNGTPNHNCSLGYCFGDYPHVGSDANVFSLTTNEFPLFGSGFKGAQLYVFSKADLAAGVATPASVYLQSLDSTTNDAKAYSVIPVTSLPSSFDGRAGGTSYFAMRRSCGRCEPVTAVALFALTNTSSIDDPAPALTLKEATVKTERMWVPQYSLQRKGPTPLIDCMNIGMSCYGSNEPTQYPPLVLDSGGDRVGGAWLHNGAVFVTISTALEGSGSGRIDWSTGNHSPVDEHVGVAWLVIQPNDPADATFTANVFHQGYSGVEGANLTYPSIAVSPGGQAVIGVTLVGPSNFPSAAFMPFKSWRQPRKVVLAARGRGPNEDPFGPDYDGWERWGDYSATTVGDDGRVWFANEYVAQRCTLDIWLADSTCNWTRTYYANWSTRITVIDG